MTPGVPPRTRAASPPASSRVRRRPAAPKPRARLPPDVAWVTCRNRVAVRSRWDLLDGHQSLSGSEARTARPLPRFHFVS